MAEETVVARVQLPDGTIGRFEVPKNMKPADIEEHALNAYMAQGRTQSVLAPETTERSVPKVLAQSAGKALANIGDVVVGMPENYKRLGNYAMGKLKGEEVEAPRLATPVTNALVRKGVFSPENEPNTPALNIADFAVQAAAPGAMTKIGSIPSFAAQLGKNLGHGVVAGTVLEGAKSAGIDNPMAQALIAGGTMAATQAPFALRHTAADVAHQATRNLTQEQLNAADRLVKESYKLGSPITGAEAISKVAGTSPLGAVQRVVESLPDSAETMSSFMAKRPQANEQMIANALRQISPVTPTSATPRNLQNAAGQLIGGAEKSVTENVQPLYQKAGGVSVYPAPPVLGNPRIQEAVKEVTSSAKYGVPNGSEGNFRTLIAAKQKLDDQYAQQMNAVTGAEKNAARVTFNASRELDDYLKSLSPEYAQGSHNYEVAQKTQLQPLREGPVGQIAEGGKASQILMPTKPEALYPEDIKRTVSLLRRENPTAAQEWVRQNLETNFNEAGQNLQNGPNQFGGAKFAAILRGNNQQAKNLEALVTESAGKEVYKGLDRVLTTLEAQGTRQGAGSQTSFNNQFQKELSEGGPLAAAKLVFKPSEVATKYEEWQLNKNSNQLANMLTNPDSIKQLQDLARTKPNSAKSQLLINSIVGGYVGQKPEMSEEEK